MISDIHGSSIMTTPVEGLQAGAERISLEQLQRLVRLVDQSDIVELEVTYSGTKVRLVGSEGKVSPGVATSLAGDSTLPVADSGHEAEPKHSTLTAPCVGFFQPWSKAKNKPLVAVGDTVKDGQLVALIRSLGVPNEVESPVTGRIIEILVHDGQNIEYGQPLMVIENC